MRRPVLPVRVLAVQPVAPDVKRFRLARRDGGALPPYSAGSHVVLSVPGPEAGFRNSYSLLGSTRGGGLAYEVAVLRSPTSRGGSAHLHDQVETSAELVMSAP